MQMTIDEYADRFKMSKEMIRAKLRGGRLPHTVEDGTTYITVDTPRAHTRVQAAAPETPQRTTAGAIIMMYQKENSRLKRKITELEAKIDRLISDKEQMLREERDRIETVYANRDEQLKSFLELVNAKLVQEGFKLGASRADETAPSDISSPAAAAQPPEQAEPVMKMARQLELLQYLATEHYTPAQIKEVKKRFAKAYGNDIRVNQQNGEFILDFAKYDYSDLLAR